MSITSDPRIFEGESYLQANASRLKALFLHIDPESLAGKRVLELGCGAGRLGEEFVNLGCRVVSVDANEGCHEPPLRRKSNLKTCNW